MSTKLYNNAANSVLHNTTEYTKFKFDPTNRTINYDHVEMLYDAIENRNLLHLFPIIVSSDGYIRDGQHRLKAAEALGVPVFYIVSDDMGIEDVASVTARVRQWSLSDYLHYYCAQDFAEYLKLREFIEEYSFLSVTRAIKLCGIRKGGGDVVPDFRDGKFVANDMRFAQRVVRACLDFRDSGIDFYSQGRFVDAVANLLANAKYDHEKMKNKLEYLSYKIVKCPDMPTYIQMFSDVYNYKVRNITELKMLTWNDADYRVDLKQN